jgi:hypothetical protein
MPIHPKRIKISLNKTNPDKLTPPRLKEQLTDVGLQCEDTATDKLQSYITDVRDRLPIGRNQTFLITKSGTQQYANLAEVASETGNWSPSGTALGYAADLETVVYEPNFDYLQQNKPSFGGIKSDPTPTTKRVDTIEAVKTLFVEIGINASSALIKGLDKDAMEAVLTNAIAPLNDPDLADYNPPADSRVIFLVENYNTDTGEADGIGVLAITWQILIVNYRHKDKHGGTEHDTTITLHARSVMYDNTDTLAADLAFIKAHQKDKAYHALLATHIKNNAFVVKAIPPKPTDIVIYGSLPPANADTFNHSLPTAQKDDHIDVQVFYAPDLNRIGCLDNTKSNASSIYSKSVTSGFTFTATQSISITVTTEVNIEFVKLSDSVTYGVTFSEQWNKSITETVEYNVPAGKRAFLYQGYMLTATLRFTPSDYSYRYVTGSTGKFLTNITATSTDPIN